MRVKTNSVHGFIPQRQIPLSAFGVGYFYVLFNTHMFCCSVAHLALPFCCLVQIRHKKKKKGAHDPCALGIQDK